LEGDDLSENLYRMCIGNPLRFGHRTASFYEDSKVIDKIIHTVTSNQKFYKIIARSTGKVGFFHQDAGIRSGLGNYKIFP